MTIISTMDNPKIGELIAEIQDLRAKYHGVTMAIAREADVNYNGLSSIMNGNRQMGYHIFFAIRRVFPQIKREFLKKKQKKSKKDLQ